MKFITYKNLQLDIIKNIHRIPRDIDLIIGIPRSGMIVANIIALYINKPFTDFDSYLSGHIYGVGITKRTDNIMLNAKDIRKVLIVEDSIDTGRSFEITRTQLKNAEVSADKILFLAAYIRSNVVNLVDIYYRIIDEERVFEWNFMHNRLLEKACFDIDGVLCVDPLPEENDDGEKYLEFIRNAVPKFIPSRTIGYLVSSRLEKYREETEEWLKKNNIEYKRLFLMQIESAEQRQKLGNHGKYKAEIYKKLADASWFVESETNQAEEISMITNKLVFCIENDSCYEESGFWKTKNIVSQSMPRKIKAFLKAHIPEHIYLIIKRMLKH